MLIRFCGMVIIGALIGWVTNWIAIKMLFHPYQEKKFIFFKIQGLIPKRRDEIGKGISEIVEKELISLKDILEKADLEEGFSHVEEMIDEHLRDHLEENIKEAFPFLSMFLKSESFQKIRNLIKTSILGKKEQISISLREYLEEKIDFQEMVQEKISSFSLEKLEQIITELAKRELRHIELIGAFLGAFLGGIQFVLFTYLI